MLKQQQFGTTPFAFRRAAQERLREWGGERERLRSRGGGGVESLCVPYHIGACFANL